MSDANKFCGLQNFGNTCYINGVLQCLNASPGILKGITDDEEHKRDIEYYKLIEQCPDDELDTNPILKKNDINLSKIKNLNIYFNFKKLIIELNKNTNITIKPIDFIIACKNVADENGLEHLFSGMQNDSNEFLVFLLDRLHEAKTSTKEIQTKFNSIEECGNSSANKIYFQAEQKFKEFYNKKSSWLIDEFYFQNICITKCKKCPYYSLSFDPLNSLIVPIPKINKNNQHLTLIDCLDHNFGKEILKASSEWKCDKCKNTELNFKQYRLFNTPNTLIINIKRFTYDYNVGDFIKNNTFIDIPQILNLSNYKLFNKNEKNMYKLYGIVNHIGNMNGGHYTSYCRNNIKTNIKNGNDEWLVYDDETISKLKTDLITPNSYMLFYRLIE